MTTKRIAGWIVAALAPLAQGQVSLTFNTDTQGVTARADAISVAWSAYGGGSLAITTAGGWKPACALVDINAVGMEALKAEFLQALANGGTLSYKITLETDGVPAGSNPGHFETMYVGNSAGVWDQTFGGTSGQLTQYGGFPLAAAKVVQVSYPIEVASTAVADKVAQFSAGSGWYELLLGLNSDGAMPQATYYVDDITITANEDPVAPVAPTLTIAPAKPGLNVISAGNGQYDRQCIRTTDPTEFSWVGGPFPVSYELTIADRPVVTGYEAVMYLVPGSGLATNVSAPDYSQPVCAGLWIYRNADASGWMALRYKDYQANSNGPAGHEYWVADPAPSHGLGGELGGVWSSTAVGTWKITFTSDTDFTLTGPSGGTTSGSFNPTVAAKFAGPMYVYFGNVPGQAANIGQSMVFSRVKIAGTGDTIDEDFLVDPFTDALERAASVPGAVVQVAPDVAQFWLQWTLPATDYKLYQSEDLGVFQAWEALPMTSAFKVQETMRRLLRLDEVYNQQVNFLKLEKP